MYYIRTNSILNDVSLVYHPDVFRDDGLARYIDWSKDQFRNLRQSDKYMCDDGENEKGKRLMKWW